MHSEQMVSNVEYPRYEVSKRSGTSKSAIMRRRSGAEPRQ